MFSIMSNSSVDKLFNKALQKLQKHWGFPGFRPGQDKAVRSVIEGNETLVLFPTGGGKSLCYQVPALVLDGLTIVISPLVALMEDQVEQLHQKNVPCTFINSTLNTNEIEQRLINARNGMYKLLYCAPERLHTPLFQHELQNLKPTLIAVDEAHCISEWGHDFRPKYRLIKEVMEPVAEKVRWLALTATATPEVRDDIINVLDFKKPVVISRGFDRPNLKWWVYSANDRNKAIVRMVSKNNSSGLIYAGTRKMCDELAESLQKQTGRKTAAYHAGLDSVTRSRIQEAWINGKIPLVVATNAFGMGIDKPDCRYVIHHDPPGSLEAYYQEAGRAGRDGDLSYTMLCYKKGDIHRLKDQIIRSYPTLEQLHTAYNGICDSLDLAAGSQTEQPVVLNLDSVSRRTQLTKPFILAALKVFDRLGIIELIKEYSNEIGIRFLTDTNGIRSLGEQPGYNPDKARFVQDIFRIYGPESISVPVYIDARYIAERTGYTVNRIVSGLDVLQNEQLLQYRLADDNPLVKLNHARESKPNIDRKSVENYRNILLKKLVHVEGYAETGDCRSRYLRIYFGETNPTACGICDNCMKAKKKLVIPESGNLEKIKQSLNGNKYTAEEIIENTGINGMVLQKALIWMKREEMITSELDKRGEVYFLKRNS